MPSAPPGVLVRPDSLVASADDGSVITFDRAGRLYAAWLDERFYRRGVDGCVLEKYTEDGVTSRSPGFTTPRKRVFSMPPNPKNDV